MTDEQREKRRQRVREDYVWYKSKGYCVNCRKEKTLPNHVLCKDCYARNRRNSIAWHKNHPETDEQKKKRNQRQKEVRAERVKNGLCAYCGKRPKVENKSGCDACLKKQRDYQLSYWKKKLHEREETNDRQTTV